MEPIVDVTNVRVLSRYVVELTFETAEVKVLALERSSLSRCSRTTSFLSRCARMRRLARSCGLTVPTSHRGLSTNEAEMPSLTRPDPSVIGSNAG